MSLSFKKIVALFTSVIIHSSLCAGNGVCFHCEEIRENNRLHPHNYAYYEDYLKEQNKTAQNNPVSNTVSNKPQQDKIVAETKEL